MVESDTFCWGIEEDMITSTETKEELEERIYNLETLSVVFLVLFLGSALALFLVGFCYLELQQENTQLKEQVNDCNLYGSIRTRVLAFNCNDDWQQIVIDGNNRSLYNYVIQKGCEVLK